MRAGVTAAVTPANAPLTGTVRVPGDKSISHRMALLAAVASGRSTVSSFSAARDCISTLEAVAALSVRVERSGDEVAIEGMGWEGLRAPAGPIDCGRSATTMRLACGLLAGTRIEVALTGDRQLLRRPMDRVAEPLRRMGARVETTGGRPPVIIRGSDLSGIEYRLPVASAQVKSALLFAGLRAEGTTTVIAPAPTRDHTERLLTWLGVPIESGGGRIAVRRTEVPPFRDVVVPGDVSSAAPLLAAAAAVPGSHVVVEDVGINATRTAFVEVLTRMGADVEIEARHAEGPEPVGTITVRHADLRSVEIAPDDVPPLIDELLFVGVLGALAEGTTVVRGAAELRVKESDRIAVLVAGLRALGADVEERSDGFAVTGPVTPRSAALDAAGDHRLAMAFAVAALTASGVVEIAGLEAVSDSFPGFLETLESLR